MRYFSLLKLGLAQLYQTLLFFMAYLSIVADVISISSVVNACSFA